MESRPFARWVASGKCPTVELLALHHRAIATGWTPADYGAWADLLQKHRPAASRLIRTLRTWAQQRVA
jgi:hypothetical protein